MFHYHIYLCIIWWWCVGWVGVLGDANFLCTLASPFVFLSILTSSESSFSISLYNWFLVLVFPKGCSCEPYILWSQGLFLCSILKLDYIEFILMDCHYVHTLHILFIYTKLHAFWWEIVNKHLIELTSTNYKAMASSLEWKIYYSSHQCKWR